MVDLSGESGQFCGQLLGDLGADVIKIEPPGGDDVRRFGPFYEDVEDVDRSLYWHAMNTSKRGHYPEFGDGEGRALLHRLLATADIVVESFARARWRAGGSILTHYSAYTQLFMASVTPFGQTGPYCAYRATEMETLALGGFMSVCGDPDRPPIRIGQPQAKLFSSVNAYTGTMLAYYHRLRGGEGQHIDVSMQEVRHESPLRAVALEHLRRGLPPYGDDADIWRRHSDSRFAVRMVTCRRFQR